VKTFDEIRLLVKDIHTEVVAAELQRKDLTVEELHKMLRRIKTNCVQIFDICAAENSVATGK